MGPYRTGAEPGPNGPGDDPDLRPATAGDLRGLRNWLVVVSIWAVAASVIALLALFGDESGRDRGGGDSAAVADLADRLDQLEGRVDAAAEDASGAAETAGELSGQVEQAAGAASEAQSAAEEASATASELEPTVDELRQRVELLEEASQPPVQGDGN